MNIGGDRHFVRDIVQVFGGQLVMMAIGIGTGIITARWLGPHDRGLLQLLVLLPTTLGNFAKLGIPQASVYFMRRRGASPSERRVERALDRARDGWRPRGGSAGSPATGSWRTS